MCTRQTFYTWYKRNWDLSVSRSVIRITAYLNTPLLSFLWLNCVQPSVLREGKNGKGKGHSRTSHEGPEGEYMYNFTLSLTSALDGVGGQRHALAAPPPPPPEKDPVPIVEVQSGRVQKISPSPELDPRTIYPVASRNTDWAIRTHPSVLCTFQFQIQFIITVIVVAIVVFVEVTCFHFEYFGFPLSVSFHHSPIRIISSITQTTLS